MYQTFITKKVSKDGFEVAIAGICKEGFSEAAETAYSKIENEIVFVSHDIFMIDYKLAEIISKISPEFVISAGASIHIDGVSLATGGVIGDPFEQNESSNGLIDKINDDIYVVAAPGNMGISYVGDESLGKAIEALLNNEEISQKNSIEKVVEMSKIRTETFFIISDGCGQDSCGMAISYNKGEEKVVKLN